MYTLMSQCNRNVPCFRSIEMSPEFNRNVPMFCKIETKTGGKMRNKKKKECRKKLRGKFMEMVKQGHKTLKAASLELDVSYRQAKRIYQRYLKNGDEGLIHGNKGRASNHRTDEELVKKAILLYSEKYSDFGPTFAQENLLERDGIKINVSTLRRALLSAGLWEQKKQSNEYRSRRTPRACFGELIQFDGSHHDWFEGRGFRCCLITLIDDATKTRLSQFFEEETIFGAMTVLKMWIELYGIPQSLYCDKKNAFILTREPTDAEILAGNLKPKSHFGKACDRLGIEVISANSAQAKGRVERNHGIDQDRLIKELRLEGISTIEEANKFLLEKYLPKMNKKFSRSARDKNDAHVSVEKKELDDIFCLEYTRKVGKDFVVRFECRFFQILSKQKLLPRPGDTVVIRVRLNYSVFILWKDKPLLFQEIDSIFNE